MKTIVLMSVITLAATSTLAQRRLGVNLPNEDAVPKEVEEKIPAEHRTLVLSGIRSEARRQANEAMKKKFEIVPDGQGWTNNCEKSLLWEGPAETFCKYDKNGRLVKTGGNWGDFEECRWRDARQKESQETLLKDHAAINAAISNAVAYSQMLRSRNQKRPCLEPLEELIPLEEAMSLAKKGKGKGYFQMALRYANGKELPRDARKAYMLLCKAVDVNYANALLVEGLCEEENLKAEVWGRGLYARRVSLVKDDGSSAHMALYEYCGNGVRFDNGNHGQETDSLTNEVAFAHVMRKYEQAKELGALTATNQIVALNKRLADFRVWLAVHNAKMEADAKKTKAEEGKNAQQRAKWEEERSNSRKVHTALGAKEQARYRVAFKEMFGYEIGEKIARKKLARKAREDRSNVRLPYRNFTSMDLRTVDDRLYAIELEQVAKDKGASATLEQEAVAVVKDLEKRYGIEFGEKRPGNPWRCRWEKEARCHWNEESYGWTFRVIVGERVIHVMVSDDDYEKGE